MYQSIKRFLHSKFTKPYCALRSKKHEVCYWLYLKQAELALFSLSFSIKRTKPFQTNPNSSTEIHTVVSEHNVYMYLCCIKSFLRFYSDIRIVMHCDGTISDTFKKLLMKHIVGIVIIDRKTVDTKIKASLSSKKYSLLCRDKSPHYFQAIDYFLFAEKEKIISLDSDILFFKYPKSLIDWIKSEEKVIRYGYEEGIGIAPVKNTDVDKFPHKLEEAGLPSGFVCLYKDVADFDLCEEYLEFVFNLPYLKTDKRFEVYIHNRFTSNIYGVYIANSNLKKIPFSYEDYKNLCGYYYYGRRDDFLSEAIFKHYNAMELRFKKEFRYLEDLKKVLKDLL